MNRKDFIKTCSYSCLSVIGLSVLMENCAPAKHIQAASSNNRITVARKEFLNKNNLRRVVVVRTEGLNHPIALYRFSDSKFSAVLLQCTHQGNELSVSGDLLTCSAHGSEFTSKGEIVQGPAEQPLKSYKVTSDNENIFIHLL